MNTNTKKQYSISGLARAIGITPTGIHRWIEWGWIPAPDQTTTAGWPLYSPDRWEVARRIGTMRTEGEFSAEGRTYAEASVKLAKIIDQYLEPLEDFPDGAEDVRICLVGKVVFKTESENE